MFKNFYNFFYVLGGLGWLGLHWFDYFGRSWIFIFFGGLGAFWDIKITAQKVSRKVYKSAKTAQNEGGFPWSSWTLFRKCELSVRQSSQIWRIWTLYWPSENMPILLSCYYVIYHLVEHYLVFSTLCYEKLYSVKLTIYTGIRCTYTVVCAMKYYMAIGSQVAMHSFPCCRPSHVQICDILVYPTL